MKTNEIGHIKFVNEGLIQINSSDIYSVGYNRDILERSGLIDKTEKTISNKLIQTMVPYCPFELADHSKVYNVIEGPILYAVSDEVRKAYGFDFDSIKIMTYPAVVFDSQVMIIADYDYYAEFGIYLGNKNSFKFIKSFADVNNVITLETFNEELFNLMRSEEMNVPFINMHNRFRFIQECQLKGIQSLEVSLNEITNLS